MSKAMTKRQSVAGVAEAAGTSKKQAAAALADNVTQDPRRQREALDRA